MKKFLAMALGLVLIGTTVITLSDASRDAYQTYLYQQALKNRAERRFSEGQRVRPTYDTEPTGRSVNPRLRNLRYPQNKRNLFGGTEQEQSNLKLRPMSNGVGFTVPQTTRETLVIKNLDPMNIAVRTVATEDFSLEIPLGWSPKIEEGVLKVQDSDVFEITVRKVEDVCNTISFQFCAINYSNNLNYVENENSRTKIMKLGHIARLSQRTDRILGTNAYVNTHKESFLGSALGRDMFISRYFIEEPGTSNLFLIETVANKNLASEAVVVTKRLTNSFRMILN